MEMLMEPYGRSVRSAALPLWGLWLQDTGGSRALGKAYRFWLMPGLFCAELLEQQLGCVRS